MTEYVFLNGEYVDITKASLPVRTHAFYMEQRFLKV